MFAYAMVDDARMAAVKLAVFAGSPATLVDVLHELQVAQGNLTRPITEGTIIGKGRVTFASKNLFNAETILTEADGNEIGRGIASFARSKMPLDSGIGYE